MNRRLIRLSEKVGFWAVDYEALSEPKGVFQAIWDLESEVNNGGFYQYFWNSSAWAVPGIWRALQAIGATPTAAIVNDAIAAVGRTLSWRDDEARRERLEALPDGVRDELEVLTQTFIRYPPNDLTTLLYRYVSKRRDEIGAPAEF
jgi:Domain of unknown function (DUF4375)